MFILRALVVSVMVILLAGCARQEKAMKRPQESDSWVIRSDFSDEGRWQKVKDLISAPQQDGPDEFFAYVNFINDPVYRDKDPHRIVLSLPDNYPAHFCFLVDRETILNTDHPVLVVGFYPSDGKSFDRLPRDTPAGDIKTFRALPSQIQGIENNLSIANMNFEEFAGAVDKDGVFRGFR